MEIKDAIIRDLAFLNNKYLYGLILIYLSYIGYTDFKHRKIPNIATYSMVIIRIILHFTKIFPFTGSSLIGAVLFFLLFFTVAYQKNIRMGGDIKAVFALGLYFGIGGSLVINSGAIFFGLLYFFFRYLKGEPVTQDINAPYGFFLLLSTIVCGAYYIFTIPA